MTSARMHDAVPGGDSYDVAICGGGPVGLAMAYLLGRAGIRVALFEKRPGTTPLPKGQSVHASTAELYRQWGVWQQLDGAGWPVSRSNGQGYYLRVSDGAVAEIRQSGESDEDYTRKWQALSPVAPRKVPASDYEAALRRQALIWPSVALHFGVAVTGVAQDGDGVTLAVRGPTGDTQRIACRYLVACDGARSFVRSQLGAGEDHGPTFGNQILTEFHADLAGTLGSDAYFHSFILDPRYAGWFGSQHPGSGLWRYSFRHDEESLPAPEDVMARIRGALGMPELPLEIVETYRFDYTTGLLRDWRAGRVLFAGDAAHWHSPWGGFGANIGVQDANNLAWKLALVVRGLASADLLDTYQAERKPRGELAVKAATYNAMHFQAIVAAALVAEPEVGRNARLSDTGTAFLREAVTRHGSASILHTGFQLGTTYDSRIVMRDGAVPPPQSLLDYEESTVPGVRAPHVWLRTADGRELSTTDLWGDAFSLVVTRNDSPWQAAAERVSAATGVAVRLVAVGALGTYQTEDPKFARLYNLEGGDALLVRPDGFVARRLSSASGQCQDSAAAVLAATFACILAPVSRAGAAVQQKSVAA